MKAWIAERWNLCDEDLTIALGPEKIKAMKAFFNSEVNAKNKIPWKVQKIQVYQKINWATQTHLII